MEAPNISLTPGQTSQQVKQLQEFLISQGISIPAGATGYYGPQTTQAVKQWQEQNGVDNTSGPGYWGPKSIAKASGTGSDALFQQGKSLLAGMGTPYVPPGGKTNPDQPLTDAEYDAGLANNAINKARIAKGNTAEMLAYAATTGDLSQLINEYGQPFTLADQQEALKRAEEDNKLYYDALKMKETTDAETALAQKQADYQDFLMTSGQKFQEDKTTLDQNAADSGILFSGGRKQKEQKLQSSYQQDQAYQQGNLGRDISGIAQDYQYKYGNDAANNLSKYYSLGGNTYNPNVATGGVGSTGLSSIYNPSSYTYQGTQNVARKTAANQRAAGYLANKGNKLLSTGYKNQF